MLKHMLKHLLKHLLKHMLKHRLIQRNPTPITKPRPKMVQTPMLKHLLKHCSSIAIWIWICTTTMYNQLIREIRPRMQPG